MVSVVQPSLVAQIVRHLPAPLLRALDAWSYRIARRRDARRQRKWLQRATAPAAEPAVKYHLKPWRD